MEDFKNLSLAEQVDNFGPALGLTDEEIIILFELIVGASINPSPRRSGNESDFKRPLINATYEKLVSRGYIKLGTDTLDFSGLIKALEEIPVDEKKRLYKNFEKRKS